MNVIEVLLLLLSSLTRKIKQNMRNQDDYQKNCGGGTVETLVTACADDIGRCAAKNDGSGECGAVLIVRVEKLEGILSGTGSAKRVVALGKQP